MALGKINVSGKKLVGNAATGDVLSGKTFSNKDSNTLVGTMTNKGVVTGSVGVGGVFTDNNTGYVTSISIAGPTLSGNAATANVLSGKTFYSNSGTKQTGTMISRVAEESMSTTVDTNLRIFSMMPPVGYYDGSTSTTYAYLTDVYSITGLTTGVIKHGTNIMGINGSYDTEPTNPITNINTVSGKIGYVNGNKVIGSLDLSHGSYIKELRPWISRTSAIDNPWKSVCYGNGLFVAVADYGIGNKVMTSPDGITWTSRSSATNIWNSVCYGNGLFVAVAESGTDNRVMTSPDGINWTSRTSAANNAWLSVCYGNGLFVAVSWNGTGNKVMTSPDGINWTSRTNAANNSWKSVCYGNGLFVAVSSTGTGNRVMTSPDGINWTIRTSAADYSWKSVCYGNGLFVAVAESGTDNRVMTSPDGITWTIRASAADNPWLSVCYGNGLFVAVTMYTKDGYNIMTSPDGINWTIGSGAANNDWNSICYGNGLFVAVSYSGTGNRVMTSKLIREEHPMHKPTKTYLSDFISRTSADNNYWKSVCYGNGLFVAVAYTGTGNRVMTSPDGINWTIRTSAADNGWYGVCYGNGLFVAVSYTGTGNRVMTSPDGIIWTSRTSAVDYSWRSICYGNGLFVAVASSGTGNRVMTSPDGINWTSRTSAADNSWRSICYGNGLFVAVAYTGTGNRVMTSPDGINWTIRTSAADYSWYSICYGNGLFVAVAYTGTGNRVMTSPDGIIWTSRTSATDNNWNSVYYGNGLFVAVSWSGTGDRVMTSPDGINWTSRTSAADNYWTSVCYGNGLFVAVAESGTDNRVMTADCNLELLENVSTKEIVLDGSFISDNIRAGTTIDYVAGTFTSDATAVQSDIISGKTAYVNGSKVTGNMPTAINVSPYEGSSELYVNPGKVWLKTQGNKYWANGTWIYYDEPNLIASNIKSGVTIGSTTKITGTYTGQGTATASCVLSGYTFSNSSGSNISGTMVNRPTYTEVGTTYSVWSSNQLWLGLPTGGYVTESSSAGSGNTEVIVKQAILVAAEPNLKSTNIRSGATVFGVSGNTFIMNTVSGTAQNTDILSGKIAYSYGAQRTGTMPSNGSMTATLTTQGAQKGIPAGYTSGGTVKASFSNLSAGNVKSGVNIGGVVGSLSEAPIGTNVAHGISLYSNTTNISSWNSQSVPRSGSVYTLPKALVGFAYMSAEVYGLDVSKPLTWKITTTAPVFISLVLRGSTIRKGGGSGSLTVQYSTPQPMVVNGSETVSFPNIYGYDYTKSDIRIISSSDYSRMFIYNPYNATITVQMLNVAGYQTTSPSYPQLYLNRYFYLE